MSPAVSIHAPAWGATRTIVMVSPDRVFQSTRPRGARLQLQDYNTGDQCFNPRARVGRDFLRKMSLTASCSFNPRARVGRDLSGVAVQAPCVVSIHAPAWGATIPIDVSNFYRRFQSTRPRGARHLHSVNHDAVDCFNPRARVGRDLPSKHRRC